MNYEEMLAAKNDGKLNRTRLPIGEYYCIHRDSKYRGHVTIRHALNESIVFSEAMKAECECNKSQASICRWSNYSSRIPPW